VPTGNFGDIFAGYVARRMAPGLIGKLVLATNANNLLSRFVNSGEYSLGTVTQTSSPSMDIQVASNFERYLYYLYDRNPARTKEAMARFAASGCLEFDQARRQRVGKEFFARTVGEAETRATIWSFNQRGYLLDPHTAVGVKAAQDFIDDATPMVCLATAHPAKFGEAVAKAIGAEPDLPLALAGLSEQSSRCEVLDADVDVVKDYLAGRAL
jgi:threonine synthase